MMFSLSLAGLLDQSGGEEGGEGEEQLEAIDRHSGGVHWFLIFKSCGRHFATIPSLIFAEAYECPFQCALF